MISAAVEQSRAFNFGSDLQRGGECLIPALQALVKSTRRLKTSIEVPQSITVGNPRTSMHLYQIAREAFSNAVLHSEGSSVHLALIDRDDELCLEVEDDGRGDPDLVLANPGMGSKLMYIRARLISGKLTFEASARGGIRVKCVVPKCP